MQGLYRSGKFNRTRSAIISSADGRIPKGTRQNPEQMSDRARRNDNILWLNGTRVADKAALLREAEGKYPIRCQFYETGERYQLSSPYRHWTRTFESKESLSWALGDIEGPFTATFRPLYPKCPGTWPGENENPYLKAFGLSKDDMRNLENEVRTFSARMFT